MLGIYRQLTLSYKFNSVLAIHGNEAKPTRTIELGMNGFIQQDRYEPFSSIKPLGPTPSSFASTLKAIFPCVQSPSKASIKRVKAFELG